MSAWNFGCLSDAFLVISSVDNKDTRPDYFDREEYLVYKKKMWVGTVMAIALLSAGPWSYVRANRDPKPLLSEKHECVFSMSQRDGKPVVSASVQFRGGEPIRLECWERDEEQWLFLPAIYRGQEVCFEEQTFVLEEGPLLLKSKSGDQVQIQILFGSKIPSAWLETESGDLESLKEGKEHQEEGVLYFVDEDGILEYGGDLRKVKLRGNSTRLQPKTPFRIRLDQDASLAGLGSSKDYVLLAEYGDISLMQNKAAMELANQTTDQYEPDGIHIDLYVNGEYMGVYLLAEGIFIGENRLDLFDLEQKTEQSNLNPLKECQTFQDRSSEGTLAKGYEILENPPDISGGYLLELEYPSRYEEEETTGFRTGRNKTIVIKEPAFASREQVTYIQDQFQRAEDAMYAEDYMVPDTGLKLEDLVDLESLVHKYLVDEICMNTDPWTTQFLYKDRGEEPFHFGPAWDYDMAFGHYDPGFSPEEFYLNDHIWYKEVYEYAAFQELMRTQYECCYLPVLQELTDTKIPEWKMQLQNSARMNFIRWDIEEIYERNAILYTGDTFDACVDSLSDFIERRTAYLSSVWLEKP